MTDSTEKLCSHFKGVRVRRLDLEYFSRIWSTLTDYANTAILWHMRKQLIPGHSPPMRPGRKAITPGHTDGL